MENNQNNVIIYHDDNGTTKVSVRFSDEDIWLTQAQIAELYDTTQQNISQHIESIYSDGELEREATYKKFLLVRTEGKRQVKRNIDHFNLDMIISLGYRVQSQVATRFRRWATERLHEYIQKGFAILLSPAKWEDSYEGLFLKKLYKSKEMAKLNENSVVRKFRTTAMDVIYEHVDNKK